MKILAVILVLHLVFSCSNKSKKNHFSTANPAVKEKRQEADVSKIAAKAEEALKFCVSKKFSTDFCILIDMSLHSGIKRFFVWDFKTKKVVRKYLVGHGCGPNPWSADGSRDNPQFSNEDGSHL